MNVKRRMSDHSPFPIGEGVKCENFGVTLDFSWQENGVFKPKSNFLKKGLKTFENNALNIK